MSGHGRERLDRHAAFAGIYGLAGIAVLAIGIPMVVAAVLQNLPEYAPFFGILILTPLVVSVMIFVVICMPKAVVKTLDDLGEHVWVDDRYRCRNGHCRWRRLRRWFSDGGGGVPSISRTCDRDPGAGCRAMSARWLSQS